MISNGIVLRVTALAVSRPIYTVSERIHRRAPLRTCPPPPPTAAQRAVRRRHPPTQCARAGLGEFVGDLKIFAEEGVELLKLSLGTCRASAARFVL